MSPEFTSKSRVVRDGDKLYRTFFCDLCGYGYTVETGNAEMTKETVQEAEEEARRHFNLCHRCRKWVCDTHYNEDVMLCIRCAPKNKSSTARQI